MRKIMMTVLALISTSAMAVNTYYASDYTCGELKERLNEERVIRIVYKSFFNTSGVHYASRSAACGRDPFQRYEPHTVSVSTLDRRFCGMGWKCRRIRDDNR